MLPQPQHLRAGVRRAYQRIKNTFGSRTASYTLAKDSGKALATLPQRAATWTKSKASQAVKFIRNNKGTAALVAAPLILDTALEAVAHSKRQSTANNSPMFLHLNDRKKRSTKFHRSNANTCSQPTALILALLLLVNHFLPVFAATATPPHASQTKITQAPASSSNFRRIGELHPITASVAIRIDLDTKNPAEQCRVNVELLRRYTTIRPSHYAYKYFKENGHIKSLFHSKYVRVHHACQTINYMPQAAAKALPERSLHRRHAPPPFTPNNPLGLPLQSRPKRGALASMAAVAAGIALTEGASALIQHLFSSSVPVKTIVKTSMAQQNQLDRLFSGLVTIAEAVRNQDNYHDILNFLAVIESYVSQIELAARTFKATTIAMVAHKFHESLVEVADLDVALDTARSLARNRGDRIPINSAFELFHLPAIGGFSQSGLHLTVLVPLIRHTYTLHRFLPHPFLTPNSDNTSLQLLTPSPSNSLLATQADGDKFIVLNEQTLSDCLKFNDRYTCSDLISFTDRHTTCISALHSASNSVILDQCPLRLHHSSFHIAPHAKNAFNLQTTKDMTITVACPDNKPVSPPSFAKFALRPGQYIVQVPPGCYASAPNLFHAAASAASIGQISVRSADIWTTDPTIPPLDAFKQQTFLEKHMSTLVKEHISLKQKVLDNNAETLQTQDHSYMHSLFATAAAIFTGFAIACLLYCFLAGRKSSAFSSTLNSAQEALAQLSASVTAQAAQIATYFRPGTAKPLTAHAHPSQPPSYAPGSIAGQF